VDKVGSNFQRSKTRSAKLSITSPPGGEVRLGVRRNRPSVLLYQKDPELWNSNRTYRVRRFLLLGKSVLLASQVGTCSRCRLDRDGHLGGGKKRNREGPPLDSGNKAKLFQWGGGRECVDVGEVSSLREFFKTVA